MDQNLILLSLRREYLVVLQAWGYFTDSYIPLTKASRVLYNHNQKKPTAIHVRLLVHVAVPMDWFDSRSVTSQKLKI